MFRETIVPDLGIASRRSGTHQGAMGAQRPRSPYENPLPRREYKLVSGFGPQVKSTMQSFPSPSFTKGSRDVEGEKVRCRGTFLPILLELTRERPPPSPSTQLYISAEHSKVMSSTIGPGPKYDPLDSVGVAPLSINRTLPRVGFASVDRSLKGTTDASMFVTDPLRKPGAPPGPGAYDHEGAVGKQRLSPKPSKPAYTIEKSSREQAQNVYSKEGESGSLGRKVPGPGAYADKLPGSIGPQPDVPSSPEVKFPADARWKASELPRGERRPGPGEHALPDGVGKQVVSTKTSEPTAPFGTATRAQTSKMFISKEHDKRGSDGALGPGPCGGAAKPRSSFGKVASSRERSSPRAAFARSTRWERDRNADGPGPGAYNA